MLLGVKSMSKDFIHNLKTVSSRYLRKEFVNEVEKVYWKDVFWANGYFIASCGGGVTVEQLKRYIEEQDRPVE
jgi:putative transposase